jgi:predicted ArsR family transcriptional regulator
MNRKTLEALSNCEPASTRQVASEARITATEALDHLSALISAGCVRNRPGHVLEYVLTSTGRQVADGHALFEARSRDVNRMAGFYVPERWPAVVR